MPFSRLIRGYPEPMTAPDPAEHADLTYETATPEQIAQAREQARRKLAEADQAWTPQRWEQFRARYGRNAA
jgi:hypothetical protein